MVRGAWCVTLLRTTHHVPRIQFMMDSNQDVERVEKLRKELNFHLYRYHVLDSPVITDSEYDALYHELVGLEQLVSPPVSVPSSIPPVSNRVPPWRSGAWVASASMSSRGRRWWAPRGSSASIARKRCCGRLPSALRTSNGRLVTSETGDRKSQPS